MKQAVCAHWRLHYRIQSTICNQWMAPALQPAICTTIFHNQNRTACLKPLELSVHVAVKSWPIESPVGSQRVPKTRHKNKLVDCIA